MLVSHKLFHYKDEVAINNILKYKKNNFISDILLKLTSLIEDIKKLSAVNKILISQSLDYINKTSHFFNKAG